MKPHLLSFAIALAFAAPAIAQVASPPPGSEGSPAADTGYFQIVRSVAPHVWVLLQPKFQVQPDGNVTVIEQSDGLVLVDAGGSAGSGRRIVEIVRGLSPKPVKAVIVSQWHGDKPQGLTEILKAWPSARTIATAATAAHLRDPNTMNTPGAPDAAANARYQTLVAGYVAFLHKSSLNASDPELRARYEAASHSIAQWGLDMDGTLTIGVKESFTDRLVIADSAAPVEAMFLGRADTDGDAIVWLPKQRVLVTGETVIAPFPYGFGSYPSDWIGMLKKLRAMPFKILVPGHGMPQTDARQIGRIRAALEDVRAQVAPLVAQGLTLNQVKAKVDLSRQRRDFIGDDPWLAHWFDDFWTTPVVTSTYHEAKGEPIVQSLH
ncbi:MAG TPA: MBL fold metallo-hydrolase [Rhizomicrobium sp.]|jgi:glyoxylase-like metal-dependent hydrolase (beta-lactamase superfamily II)|nr:MBL fold metallo-hydrolase [Rhizomicrobium sp.]